MSDTIHVWIGTDRFQQVTPAEDVLEYSIRRHTSRPIEIHWMRAGDPGWELSADGSNGSWAAGAAIAGGWVKSGTFSWGTPFSNFRLAIPELMGFEGHAIYLDADMLLLDDIGKLWDMKPAAGKGIRCINKARTDVSVIDCSYFKDKQWYPRLDKLKSVKAKLGQYMRFFLHHGTLDTSLPAVWNDIDGKLYDQHPDEVKLLHYSHVPGGQPWCPYDNITYPKDWPHIDERVSSRAAAELWFTYKDEMEAANA